MWGGAARLAGLGGGSWKGESPVCSAADRGGRVGRVRARGGCRALLSCMGRPIAVKLQSEKGSAWAPRGPSKWPGRGGGGGESEGSERSTIERSVTIWRAGLARSERSPGMGLSSPASARWSSLGNCGDGDGGSAREIQTVQAASQRDGPSGCAGFVMQAGNHGCWQCMGLIGKILGGRWACSSTGHGLRQRRPNLQPLASWKASRPK